MRWENATVVDIRRKRGFAICLEVGRHLRIFPRRISLSYAPLGKVSRIPEPCAEQSDYFLSSFFPHKIVALLADEKKAAWLGPVCHSQHAFKWPVRGTEQRRVDPMTAASTAASWRRAVHQQQPKARALMIFFVFWGVFLVFLSGGSLNEWQFVLPEGHDVKPTTADSGSDSFVY